MSLDLCRERLAHVRNAEDSYHRAVEGSFVPHARVKYRRGDGWCAVWVVEAYRDRVKVRGATGREYWVYAARFLEPVVTPLAQDAHAGTDRPKEAA